MRVSDTQKRASSDNKERVRRHLCEALSSEDVAEKQFHVRQAIQLLDVEE